MDPLAELNPEQRQAVEHSDGPLLVVAGAGTGKTRVIAHRMAYLIAQGKAKPSEVLALTFTEKAAREMAERLYDLIGWESFTVPVLTFNAFGAELLGRYASHLGRPIRGGLINDTQKVLLLRQHLGDIELKYYGLQGDVIDLLERIVGYLGQLQNAGIGPEDYRRFADSLTKEPGERHPADIAEQQDLASFYELYEKVKLQTGTYDYHDQLAIPLRILQERPNLAERLTKLYRYVLVDEYQDTSPVQDALLRCFVPTDGNIFAVGDDDQAIYGFRGADIENILHFTEHFKVKQPLALTRNYRSGQPILDVAYRLIRHNDPDRLEARLKLDKQLKAVSSQATVRYTPYRTPGDEQTEVIAAIKVRLEAGQVPSEVAVLARSNAALRTYARALRQQRLPFAISTTMNIFEQRELIHLWYLLEWIGHRATDEAIAHVIMGPFVGWGAVALRSAIEQTKTDLTSLETVLRQRAEAGEATAAQLIERLDQWRGWAATLPVSQLGYRLVFETGLADELIKRADDEPRIPRIFEDLQRLLSHMLDFETAEAQLDTTLSGYLATFPKPPEVEVSETIGDPEGVQLLTVHASKGLEFQTVYLVGVTAKSWSEQPHHGELEVPSELTPASELPAAHELRRLLYVAVTRAKSELLLSSGIETAGNQRQTPSPFLEELLGESLSVPAKAAPADNLEKSLQKLQRFYPLQSQLPQRLPFENADGWINLGIGDMERYERSPHDFYLQRVLGISQPFGPQLAFGTAIHHVINCYYTGRLQNQPVGLQELRQQLDDHWSDQGYVSRAAAETARQRAHQTVAVFYQREESEQRDIRSSEQPIILEIPEAKLRLHGRIDATIMTPQGLEIRDFKTGQNKNADSILAAAKKSSQLRSYALAVEELNSTAPTYITLDYVVTGIEGQVKLTPRLLSNHRDKLIKLADDLRQRKFDPGKPSDFHNPAAFKYYGNNDDEETA